MNQSACTKGALRIAQLDKFESCSGGEAPTSMLDLVQRQRDRGHMVELLSTEGDVGLQTPSRDQFLPRIRLGPPPSGLAEKFTTFGTMLWSTRKKPYALVNWRDHDIA